MNLFDLNPDVAHLIPDEPPPIPVPSVDRPDRVGRVRNATGRWLIALGAALVVEDRRPRRSVAR